MTDDRPPFQPDRPASEPDRRATEPDRPATHGSPERAARQLDAPLLQLDLAAETASLRTERAFVEGDRNARTLAKSSWFRLTLVALRPGASFEEADQRGLVAIQVLEGGLTLALSGGDDAVGPDGAAERPVALSVGHVAVVGPGQPWQARSMGETIVLIQLSWPPEPGDAG
ncbi:MAG TPA: hypothetical protein VFW92_05420 [Candidatus Limnocylindrales bacterium]|nr:hypothetical protein [Candidatus Limnocylindrales bacterium]